VTIDDLFGVLLLATMLSASLILSTTS